MRQHSLSIQSHLVFKPEKGIGSESEAMKRELLIEIPNMWDCPCPIHRSHRRAVRSIFALDKILSILIHVLTPWNTPQIPPAFDCPCHIGPSWLLRFDIHAAGVRQICKHHNSANEYQSTQAIVQLMSYTVSRADSIAASKLKSIHMKIQIVKNRSVFMHSHSIHNFISHECAVRRGCDNLYDIRKAAIYSVSTNQLCL